jgi:hypothetical protein
MVSSSSRTRTGFFKACQPSPTDCPFFTSFIWHCQMVPWCFR